jgi:predicted PurR-regulated permease PerM
MSFLSLEPSTYGGAGGAPSGERRARWLIGGLAVAIGVALYPFAPGLLGAAVLAVAASPISRRLSHRLGLRAAALVAATTALVVVLIPGAALVTTLLAQAPVALRGVAMSSTLQRLGSTQIAGIDIGGIVRSTSDTLLSWGSQQAIALFGGVTRGTLNLFIAFVGLYYLLISGDDIWRRVSRLLPFSAETAEVLRGRFRDTTQAMLAGIAVTALAQGSIVGGAFAFVGLSDAVFWGMVAGAASILPLFGTSLVWVPGTLVLVAEQRYGAALALGAIGFVVASNVDNVLRPLIYRRISHIHPMTALVGAFAGVRLFGLVGLLLGPLSIAYLGDLIAAYQLEYGGAERGTAPPPNDPAR